MRRSTAFYGRAMACFSIILAIGCPSSSSRMVPAGGTVTYNGIPVQGASVSFTPVAVKNGRAAIGSTNSDGRFALTTLNHDDGAIPGQYKVTVIKMENPQDAIGNGDKPEARMRFTGHHPRLMALKSLIPEKYGNVKTSGLWYTVSSEGGELVIELKDD